MKQHNEIYPTIFIQQPKVIKHEGKVRLTACIVFKGIPTPVWFEVEEQYGKYLCAERSDAFLIGMLNIAMREGCDIECEAPVTAQLLYQIRTYLIPSLVRNSTALYPTQITAKLEAEPIQNAGGVGAGISCGVDSLHVVKNYAHTEYPGLKLTHLVLNNVGAFQLKENNQQYHWQTEHAKNFCKEYGFELIQTNSNFAVAIKQNHLLSHTYSSLFAVYALQKLWNVYFYGSSGHDFQEYFSLINNELYDAACYELLSLDVFSTRQLKVYSEGGALNRFEKTEHIIDFLPAQKYLHVCTSDVGPNCSKCSKCMRTILTLEALGVLNKFNTVFDINYFNTHKTDYFKWLYIQQKISDGDTATKPIYNILKSKITLMIKIRAWISILDNLLLLRKIKRQIIVRFPACHQWYRKHIRHYKSN